jgi:hypothetical protein
VPDVAPGPGLAAGLAAVLAALAESAEALDDHTVVELVVAWRRLASWACAGAARAAAELARRDSMRPDWPEAVGSSGEPCVAGDELALRLGISRRSAQDLVRTGEALEGPLWPSGEALARGSIDEGKARVVVHGLRDQAWQVALEVQARVLPSADRRTHTQLARDVERALTQVDPDGADHRAARATAGRRVCRPRVLPDGMAGIWAVLLHPRRSPRGDGWTGSPAHSGRRGTSGRSTSCAPMR